jgi:hypothetical protein
MAAIFDLLLTPTSNSIQTGPIVIPDHENVGKAVEISLLSCIQAEIYVIHTYFRFMATILISDGIPSSVKYVAEVPLRRPAVW